MLNFPAVFWKAPSGWQLRANPSSDRWRAIAHNGTLFCAVSDLYGGVMTSPDGINWTDRSGTGNRHSAIVWAGAQFVAVGATKAVMTSPDGLTWTSRSGVNAEPRGIAWNGSILVAVGFGLGNSTNVMTSADGVTWTLRSSFQSDDLNAVCWSGSRFIAVGQLGTVQTSADGITWDVQVYVPSSRHLKSVIRFGSTLVAVSDTGAVYTSATNGASWVEHTVVNNAWYGIASNGVLLAAVGISGVGNRVITSADGSVWAAQTSAADAPWYAVAYGGGLFVAVGDNGSNGVMTSSDGVGE